MTTLVAPIPDEVGTQRRVEASHRIEFEGRHAIIREVELFGEVEDGGALGEITLDKLREIADYTADLIRDGRYPLIVLRHAQADDGSADHTSYGRIENVRVREGEKTYIVGDLRVSSFDLEHLVNNYPRRSAEIAMLDGDADGRKWMKNVALIGRETPGAALPDIALFSSEVPTVDLASDTPEITFTAKGSETMKLADVKKFIEDMKPEDRKGLFASFDDKDGDKSKDKDDDKGKDKQADNTADTSDATFEDPRVVLLMTQVGGLQAQLTRQEASARLTELERQGFEFDFDTELKAVTGLSKAEDRDAHFTRIEQNYKRRQTADTLIGASQQTGGVAAAATEGAEQTFTAADAAKISTYAAKLRESEPDLDLTVAMAKAASALGMDGKLQKFGIGGGN